MTKYLDYSIVEFKKYALLKRILIELITFILFLAPAFFYRWLLDNKVIAGESFSLLYIIPVLLYTVSLHIFSFYFQKYRGQVYTNSLLKTYYKNMTEKIASSSIPAYEAESKSKILNIMNMDIMSLYVLSSYLIGIPVNIVKLVVVFGLLFWANPILGLITLLLAPLYLLSTYLNKDKLSDLVAKERAAGDKFMQDAHVIIEEKKSLDLYGAFDFMLSRFENRVSQWIEARNRQHFYLLLTKELPLFISTLVPLLFLIIGGNSVVKGTMSLGTLVLLLQLTGLIFEPLAEIASLRADMQSQMPVFKRGKDFMSLSDKDDEIVPEINSDNVLQIQDALVLDGAGKLLFSVEKLKLQGPGLYILKGDNGTGKSTLFNIITGVFGPEQLKEADNFSYQLSRDYTNSILYMCFPNFIFEGSVEENICYGRGISKDDVAKILEQLHGPNPQKHIVTRPENLSMGEKQKVFLARTLLSDSNFFLLDEPGSNLDVESEKNLIDILAEMKKDKLIFVISHNEKYDDIADGEYVISNHVLRQA